MTEHLAFSLPYRALFAHGMSAESLPNLVDALVVLLVRLHLADFYWGDVSLSNVLFRRSAGGFAAYLVDAETGELRPTLSRQMREYDVQVGCENVFAELLDLQAGGAISSQVQGHEIVALIQKRYDDLWNELTSEEEFGADEMWRIEQRIERLNDLGFDVDELDIVTDFDGDRIRIQPKVVELGHHRRELQSLTGLDVEDAQARRLLNDMASFIAHYDLGREDKGDRGEPLADRDLRADHGDGAARGARQARAGRDLPRDPRAPVVPLRARRPRGRHLRDRPRLHRHRARREARRARRRRRRPGRRRRRTPSSRPARRHRSRSRPITIRWIWLVPSKIWVTLASRKSRSTGYSRV